VIDTPAGSRNKYKYDTGLGAFCISRRLPAGLCFPHDFGFVPQTCAEDGDALLSSRPSARRGSSKKTRCRMKKFAVRWLNATAQIPLWRYARDPALCSSV